MAVEKFAEQDEHFKRHAEAERIQELINRLYKIDTIVAARWLMLEIEAEKEEARAEVLRNIRSIRRQDERDRL